MSKIEDFGEKLHGAKKDLYTSWKDSLSQPGKINLGEPLSKIWPEPNYKAIKEDSEELTYIDWMRASRDWVGNKPGVYQLARWKEKLTTMLTINQLWAADPVLTNGSAADILGKALKDIYGQELNGIKTEIEIRALIYYLNGHEKSLKQLKIGFHKEKGYMIVVSGVESFANHDKFELVNEFYQNSVFLRQKTKREKTTRLAVLTYNRLVDGCKAAIGVKHLGKWLVLKNFKTLELAREHLKDPENNKYLLNKYENWRKLPKLRGDKDRDRIGLNWRDGKNVTPAKFQETFGFRGVQFGNYVENDRRQEDLNNAYDALMDLAHILDIPTKSLSLEGTLGLAFGARGQGGINAAKAHYEAHHKVINLTKTNGAGSLAHEWFHAFDHFCAQKLRVRTSTNPFLSNAVKIGHDTGNEQIKDNFTSLYARTVKRSYELDKRRSKEYWSLPHEIAARNFEAAMLSCLENNGFTNDYLVNISPQEMWQGMSLEESQDEILSEYPYPLKGQESEANQAEFLSLMQELRALSPSMADGFDHAPIEELGRPSFEDSEFADTQINPIPSRSQMRLF